MDETAKRRLIEVAIPDRCVNLRPFDRPPLPADWLTAQVADAATSDTRLAASAPAIGLLWSPAEGEATFLKGGRAMERIWLAATAAKIHFQPMTVATLFIRRLLRHGRAAFDVRQRQWLGEAWGLLQDLFPVGEENAMVLLFRIGYGPPARARSLRRPAESFCHAP